MSKSTVSEDPVHVIAELGPDGTSAYRYRTSAGISAETFSFHSVAYLEGHASLSLQSILLSDEKTN